MLRSRNTWVGTSRLVFWKNVRTKRTMLIKSVESLLFLTRVEDSMLIMSTYVALI
jgi:hypothetical protein